jgi:hypothetical protein
MLRRPAVVVGVLATVFVSAQAARASTIELGARIPIPLTTAFALPVQIVGANELTGWEFSLLYDPTDVQVDTACVPFVDTYCDFITLYTTEGNFFAAGAGFNVLNPGAVLDDGLGNQTGTLLAAQGLYGGPLPAPSGDGVLAYVRFIVLGEGNSTIRVVDGITTEATPVPEPSTLLLVTLGLPLARRCIRRR